MLLDFSHPGLDRCEALSVRDIVRHDDSVSTLVVAGGDGLEALLASSVPNLQLDRLAVDVNRSDLEVHTNRRHEVLSEHIVLQSSD